jgi:hypothetical protein
MEGVAKGFHSRWKFPNCLGALDGKHVLIRAPARSGSLHFNYKGTQSVFLMALVDSNYNFIYVDAGCNGRVSDGGVFRNSSLSSAIEENALNIPPGKPLPGRQIACPYVIVADAAFPLRENIMKAHAGSALGDMKKR